MNLEELKKDPEFVAFLKEQTTAAISTATDGLSAKNTELLGEIKTLRKNAGSLSNDDIEDLKKKAKIADDLEAQKLVDKGEYETLLSNIRKQHATDLETRDAKIEAGDKTVRKLLVDGGLTSALANVKVNPVFMEATKRLLSPDVQVVEDNGEFKAVVGDKPVADFVKEWAGGDVGKNFILAEHNSGGGGGNGGGEGADENEKYFDPNSPEFNMTEQSKVYTKDAAVYDSMIKKFEGVEKKTG